MKAKEFLLLSSFIARTNLNEEPSYTQLLCFDASAYGCK